MKTVSQQLLDNLDGERQINARVTIRDNRLRFANYELTYDSNGAFHGHDACVYNGTSILRVMGSSTAPSSYLAWVNINSLSTQAYNWTVSNIQIDHDCTPGVENGTVYYIATDGYLYKRQFTGSGWGSATQIANIGIGQKTAIAPMSDGAVMIQRMADLPGTVPMSEIILVKTDGSKYYFYGQIYGADPDIDRFDAVKFGNEYYAFFTDIEGGRANYLRYSGDNWGSVQPVIPMDVVDDTSYFKLGGAEVINDKIFVSGWISRPAGMSFVALLIGHAGGDMLHFSMGRDIYIDEAPVYERIGKMLLWDNNLLHIGWKVANLAPGTMLTGYDNPNRKIVTSDVYGIGVAWENNFSGRFQMSVMSNHPDANNVIRGGSDVTLEVGYGGEYVEVGTFNIDTLVRSYTGSGLKWSLMGRSDAGKRLGQWTADASFDYWSQDVRNSNPADLTEVIRYSGKFSGENELRLDRLNEDGILYSLARPSRGQYVEARFTRDADTNIYESKFGIVLNFKGETKLEAADRLGVDSDELTEQDYGWNGILCAYDTTLERFTIENFVDGQAAYTIYAGTNNAVKDAVGNPFWLRATFNDGRITIGYKLYGQTSWTNAVSTRFADSYHYPWRSEQVGRAAIYMRNITPYSPSPGFSSSTTLIPVEDNSPFGASGTVLVDDEQIEFSGKSTNETGAPKNMLCVEGHTFGDPTHPNPYFVSSVFMATGEPTAPVNQSINNADEWQGIAQSFRSQTNFTATSVWVKVKKVGNPGTALRVYVGTDDLDNGRPAGDLSTCVAAGSLPAASISTSMGWVEVPMNIKCTEAPPENYWVMVSAYSFGATNPITDGSNYYQVQLSTDLAGSPGYCQKYGRVSGDWKWETILYQMPFSLQGDSPLGEGYEIYFENADVSTPRDKYDDLALVVVDGPGKGALYKITDYDYIAPNQWSPNTLENWEEHVGDQAYGSWVASNMRRVFVEEDPSGVVVPGSKCSIYPVLNATLRAANDTVASTHTAGNVNVYSSLALKTDRLSVYTTDLEWRLEDALAEIAHKAGISQVTARKYRSGSITLSGTGSWSGLATQLAQTSVSSTLSRTAIARFRRPSGTFEIGAVFWGLMVTIDGTGNVRLYTTDGSTATLVETKGRTIYQSSNQDAWITVSFQTEYVSVYVNGTLVAGFETELGYSPNGFVHNKSGSVTFEADWSELDKRIDNFIVDIGTDGFSSMGEVLGEKRASMRDQQFGGAEYYWARDTINDAAHPYELTVGLGETENETDLATVTRVEGGDVGEYSSAVQMAEHGYIFKLVGRREVDDSFQAQMEARRALIDMVNSYKTHTLTGAYDPRIEPGDMLYVRFPDFSVKKVYVDRVGMEVNLEPGMARMDMELRVREVILEE